MGWGPVGSMPTFDGGALEELGIRLSCQRKFGPSQESNRKEGGFGYGIIKAQRVRQLGLTSFPLTPFSFHPLSSFSADVRLG